MKKTTYLWIFVLVAGFLFVIGNGCDGDHDAATENTDVQTEAQENAAQAPAHDGLGTAAASQKTASGKWKANPETTNTIERMMNMVGSFSSEDAKTHCSKLKRVLNAAFKEILQRCTMTGEAHDALHEYLLPLKEKIEGLSPDDPGQCLESVKDISEYLSTYYDQFE